MTYPNNANEFLPNTIQIPSAMEIISITQSYPAIVSCVVDPVIQYNTYIPGQVVSFFIPFGYGMQQLNGKQAQVIAVNGYDLTVDVDSTDFDPFQIPLTGTTPASISPSGSRNLQFSNYTRQLPFQSLNNRGN